MWLVLLRFFAFRYDFGWAVKSLKLYLFLQEKRRASLKEQKKDVMDGQLSERKPRDQNEANNNEMEYLKSIRKSLEQQDKGGLNYLSLT